ncbi:MAG TPA: tRNA (N6-isopentenyl adenosine(37)-C2)-methylthiotransferase MiaB [Candidatus Edwardsbacteria bacterium]|nr:tRNA (N6-isopentenyl adenosine(37)-C2)-methylthiotransferase MiaB [Candidatus Edwardsbacteria bacterium]
MAKSFYIESYGCQMNLYDSARIRAILASRGWREAGGAEDADIIVLNSCAVRGHAEERVLGRLGELKGLKARRPGLVLALAGCVAQERGSRLLDEFGQLDVVVGTESYDHLPELLQQAQGGAAPVANTSFCSCDHRKVTADFGHQATGFVAVIKGCDNFCSYCIVPYVRGRERSRPPQEIVAEIESMAVRGARDITLVGQNVNSYRYGDVDFAGLLAQVAAIEAIGRVRFITSHPKDCGEKLLGAMVGLPKVCPHLHLPLQSGDDRVLQLMNRGYGAARYRELAAQARAAVPGLVLTTDVLVGFPGETEQEFQQTLKMVEDLRFDAAFTYQYSARPGTKAASLPDQLPEEVKLRRLDELIKLQNRITLESNRADVGKTFEVMAEGPSKRGGTQVMGRTRGNKPTVFDGGGKVNPGDLVQVEIHEATPGTLIGKML